MYYVGSIMCDPKKYGKLVDKKLKAADRAKRWGVS